MNELHLFSGIGGGILGGMLLGHTCVCAVEIEPYCRKVLLQRQRDGILPKFPIWDDVQTFDGKPWRGQIDCVCGGFPCADISAAGKGAGIAGKQSSLWGEMARIIDEVRPHYAFIENSPMLTVRGLDRVLCDLAKMGYDARWCVMGGRLLGKTNRERMWILGSATGFRVEELHLCKRAGFEVKIRGDYETLFDPVLKIHRRVPIGGIRRMDNGVSDTMERYRAVGMAQIPDVAANAFRLLMGSNIGQ